ncbi:MAG: hypothetical protein JSW47_08450 [Phycisphaerales bacterium]|nr:MAG: hypothetical protein JSW47_08450 [Phycisphaerales bacterium]
MHAYSINSPERWRVLFFIAAVSIALAKGLDLLLNTYWAFGADYFSIPSAFAIYGIFYAFFDKHLWKIGTLRTIGLIETPNFSGTWNGEATSSIDDYQSKYQFKITVHQTWAKISLYLEGDTRVSESTMAAMEKKNPTHSKIEWGFLSKNKPEYQENEYMFYGVTRLDLRMSKNHRVEDVVEGDYYTDKSRDSYGKITLTRA